MRGEGGILLGGEVRGEGSRAVRKCSAMYVSGGDVRGESRGPMG